MQPQDYQVDTFDPKGKKILFISAHPDDADFGAGGTILKWIEQGARAAIIIATNGDKGSADEKMTSPQLAETRHREQLAASEFLGLDNTWFFNMPDAHLEINQTLKERIVRVLREYRPDAIFTFDPTMVYSRKRGSVNHPDHRAIGQAALDAVFPMARDFLTFPQHKQEGLPPHKVTDVFLYNHDSPNYFVDTSNTIDKKLALLLKHESQIDSEKIESLIYDWAKRRGEMVGLKYAEAFVHLTLE